MNKRIMLLVLPAVSVAMLVLPAASSALVSLHLNPTPSGEQTIEKNGSPILRWPNGNFVCGDFSANATFNAGGTSGSMTLTLGKCEGGPVSCTITTTTLPFHLVTLPENGAGILMTTNNGHFATHPCNYLGLPITVKLTGAGLIGTLTAPKCGVTSSSATIVFSAFDTLQNHTKVFGTETEYTVTKGSDTIGLDAHGTITFPSQTQLVCT